MNNRIDSEQNAMIKTAERAQKLYLLKAANTLSEETFEEVINTLSVTRDMRIYLINIDKDSLKNIPTIEGVQSNLLEDLTIILEGNSIFNNRVHTTSADNLMLFYGQPLYNDSDKDGVILIYTPYNNVFDSIKPTILQIVTIGILGWLIATLSLYLLTKKIIKPIAYIEENALKLAQGKDIEDLKVLGNDEITSLTLSFNAMKNSIKDMDEERNTFVSMVSHELKTPLMSINGYLEAIQDGIMDDDSEAIDIIYSESQKLTKMTKELVTNMRNYKGFTYKPEEICLKTLIERQTKLFIGRTFTISCPEDLSLYADQTQMEQIFKNLISNAVKYSKDHTSIEINGFEKNDIIQVEVIDRGYGMSKNDLKQLFNPYFRSENTKDLVEGSGIGMNVVQRLVHLQGGTIQVDSKIDEGTTIKLVFKGGAHD